MKSSILKSLSRTAVISMVLSGTMLQLAGQTESGEKLPQYLFPGFARGIIMKKDGSSINNLVMNYNTLTEKIVFEKSGSLLELTDIESVDTIYLQNRKFVPVDQMIYEVLVNAPIALFIQHKSNLIEPGSPAGYGSTSQTSSIKSYSSLNMSGRHLNLELPADYKVNPTPMYWIRKDNNMSSFITRRQFLQIFPDKQDEIKKFMKQNRIKMTKRDDLIIVIKYCNGII